MIGIGATMAFIPIKESVHEPSCSVFGGQESNPSRPYMGSHSSRCLAEMASLARSASSSELGGCTISRLEAIINTYPRALM